MLCYDVHYMKAAYELARKSGDLSTQNGAIIVNPWCGTTIGRGWNDVHAPLLDAPERRSRPGKYLWTEHAERAAVYDAARNGAATEGAWMFCPWFACAECGRAIIMAGIKRVVGHHIPQHDSRPDWKASIEVAMQMFKEAGVKTEFLTGELGVTFRFDGKDVTV